MKRIVLMLLIMMLVFAGCGAQNVEVTFPASLFEGEELDDIIAEAKEDGIGEVIKNEDGSITYKMSKSVHTTYMKEMKNGFVEYVDEIKNSGEYPSISDVIYNDSLTEMTLVVDQEKYQNSFDGFVVSIGLGMMATLYQACEGVSPEEVKVTISVKNAETGEIFDTINYPEALEELGE